MIDSFLQQEKSWWTDIKVSATPRSASNNLTVTATMYAAWGLVFLLMKELNAAYYCLKMAAVLPVFAVIVKRKFEPETVKFNTLQK